MPVKVHFGANLRSFTDGVADLEIEASAVWKLIKVLDEKYPGLGTKLSEGTSVAINGEIIPDAEYEDLPDGAEVHFLEALGGG